MEGEEIAALRTALAGIGGAVDARRGELRGAPDIFVHQRTGMRFPRRIGPFLRRTVNRFDATGSDMGIAYERREGFAKSAHVSAYLYPVPRALSAISPASQAAGAAALFARMKADVGDGQVEEEVAFDPPLFGYRARTAATALFDGTEQPVAEGLWLYAYLGREWVLAYRATWPAGMIEAGEDCATLVETLAWPRSFGR